MKVDKEYHSKPTTFFLKPTSASAGNSKEKLSLDSEMSLPLTSLMIQDTVYKGEGNANIVIALPHEHKVTRFRKSLPGEVSPDGGKTRVQREVGYARNVVSCFLGSYMEIPEIVRYDAADITKLSDAIRSLRPVKRRHKEITDTYATKFPDYTFLDLHWIKFDQTVFRSHSTFCVEIKPKQGYLQKEQQRFPGCPYCLNQYAKLRKKNIVTLSNYCPFDLFSGKKTRMKATMEELLKSPQNNLKIFKDGHVVYGQESSPSDLESILDEWFRNATTANSERASHVDEFCNLVCAALTQPFVQEQLELPAARPCNFLLSANQIPTFCAEPGAVARAEWCLHLVGKNCNFDSNELPINSVLGRIRNMQRLSYVNTNYIYSIYSKFASLLNDDMIYSDLTKLDENSVVQKAEAVKEVCFLKNTAAKNYSDDLNGNRNAVQCSSKCILSINNDRKIVNGSLESQIEISPNLDTHQSFYGNKRYNQRANDDGDERKANTRITAQHLSMLQNYLLFATARDCSILMTFRELNPKNVSKVPIENTIKLTEQLYFLSSVKISDLDPKSVHSIKKHQQRDVDIFDSVIALLKEGVLIKNR